MLKGHHDARPLRAEHFLRIAQVVSHVFSHGTMVRQDAEDADHTHDLPPATKLLDILAAKAHGTQLARSEGGSKSHEEKCQRCEAPWDFILIPPGLWVFDFIWFPGCGILNWAQFCTCKRLDSLLIRFSSWHCWLQGDYHIDTSESGFPDSGRRTLLDMASNDGAPPPIVNMFLEFALETDWLSNGVSLCSCWESNYKYCNCQVW